MARKQPMAVSVITTTIQDGETVTGLSHRHTAAVEDAIAGITPRPVLSHTASWEAPEPTEPATLSTVITSD